MLSIQHVSVSIGSRIALRDVCLDVQPKDLVCVLGEEGSGKTTMLRLLLRDLQPDEGVIKVDTAILSQLPREVLRLYRSNIGYLPQNASLDASLTVARNVALPLDLRGMEKTERNRRVADILKRLHLTGIADTLPKHLSRGERQLTAFARTIVSGPMILLLDEPFQSLSEEAAGLVAGLVENMRKKGTTIIAASAQDRTAASFRSPRIVSLARGKLTEQSHGGAPTERMRMIADAATTHLVHQSSAPSAVPEAAVTSEPVDVGEQNEKKKIRITAVGSL